MNILVTGGAGFIGSNFCHYWRKHHPEDKLFIVDKFGYASNWNNLKGVIGQSDQYGREPRLYVVRTEKDKSTDWMYHDGLKSHPEWTTALWRGDLSQDETKKAILNLGKEDPINFIINFASESHVDNSISAPEVFIDSNVKGMFNVLEIARELKIPLFHISTDEVLKHKLPTKLGWNKWGFDRPKEDFPVYAPSSVYSATKASQEMLVKAYRKTYGCVIDVIRMTNNYGPRQHTEKLIPMTITKALAKEIVPVYKDGQQMRDWTYVFDTCRALDLIIHKSKGNKTWHIAANQEQRNIDVVYAILKKVRPVTEYKVGGGDPSTQIALSYRDMIEFVIDRLGHDFSYSLDSTSVRRLGWEPQVSFEEGLKQTIDFYV